MILRFSKNSGLNAIQSVSGIIIILISLLAITGWLCNIRVLSSIYYAFIPMAPISALVFIPFGLFFVLGEDRFKRGYGKTFTVFIAILSLYCGLQFIEYFLRVDLTFDSFLFPSVEKLKNFPLNQMSPYTGLLFFLSGITILLKLKGGNSDSVLNIVAGIGLIILFAAFAACLGYLFGTPFLYSGNITPLAATTSLAFFCLGCALIALANEKTFLITHFIGQTANARILRAILPIVVLGILVEGFLDVTLVRHFEINSALLVALLTLFMVMITIVIVIRITRVVFKQANNAEIERKLTEEELLKFKLGIERSDEVIFMTDIDGNIVYVNPSFEKIYGYKKEEVLGKNPRTLKKGILSDSFYSELGDTLSWKRTVSMEFINKTKEGELLNIEQSVNPILDESKKLLGYLAVQHNITQRKQAELRLLDYSEKLKISNDTKDKLFSIIAHDLKSPFNSILGFSQVLIADYDVYNHEEKKHFIRKIEDSAKKAFTLVENLLIWSSTQTGGITANPIEIDLSDIIRKQADFIANLAEAKGVKIKCDLPPGAIAYADKDMVKTVLLNLMNNAIKFTPKEGKITITIQDLDDKTQVSITNTGLGISQDHLEKLFKAHLSESTLGTLGEKGTGLGLIICKEFVEKNGGNIRAESEQGKGSKFCFTLPKAAPKNMI